MKRKLLYATVFALAHYAVGIGFDFLLGYNILIPASIIGVACLCLWGWLSYRLYDSADSVFEHTIYMCLPVAVLFLVYIPLVRVAIINIPLIYIAPIFTLATSLAAQFTLPITVWTCVLLSIVLMILTAYGTAVMKKSSNINQ